MLCKMKGESGPKGDSGEAGKDGLHGLKGEIGDPGLPGPVVGKNFFIMCSFCFSSRNQLYKHYIKIVSL